MSPLALAAVGIGGGWLAYKLLFSGGSSDVSDLSGVGAQKQSASNTPKVSYVKADNLTPDSFTTQGGYHYVIPSNVSPSLSSGSGQMGNGLAATATVTKDTSAQFGAGSIQRVRVTRK